jgi:hypothetical protein
MATQAVTLPFADAPTNVAGANVDWVNPGNAQASDNAYASVTWTAANQTSDPLQCLNLDTTNLPLLALPVRADVEIIGAKDGLVNNRSYFSNVTLRRNNATYGSADTTTNGDAVNLTTVESNHSYDNGFGTPNPALTRAIVDGADFGCRIVGHGRAATVSGDRLDLDQAAMTIQYDDRAMSGVAGANRSGYLAFTANRGFIGNTVFDWRTNMKVGAGLTESSGRFRIQWQVDSNGTFVSPVEFYTPSVSDARAWDQYPEGDDPLGSGYEQDPQELLLLAAVPHNQTRYARCRVVLLDTDGTILEAGAWSGSASATRNTLTADPSWATQSIPGGTNRPEGDLARCNILLFHLGGGAYEGAAAADQLGLAISASVDNSYWKGVRAIFDTALTAAGEWAPRIGFFCRSAFGTRKVLDSASTSTEWFDLQGGRNNDLTSYSSTGLGSSPAMMPTLQVYEHARNLPAGDTRTQMLSVVDDLDELAGIGVPVIMYHSLVGSAHIHIDGGDDAATHTQILNAHGLLHPLNSGFYIDLDVFFNAAPTDPDTLLPSMEYRVAQALQSYGRRWLGERLGKTENADWHPELGTYTQAGDNLAFSLLLDDDAYLAAKTLGVREDLREYLNAGETDPDDHPDSVLTILMVTTGFCQWVAAGADNPAKCARALDVCKDIWYTWGGSVLPAILSQAIWDEMDYDDLDDAMKFIQAIRASQQAPNAMRTRTRRDSRLCRARGLA